MGNAGGGLTRKLPLGKLHFICTTRHLTTSHQRNQINNQNKLGQKHAWREHFFRQWRMSLEGGGYQLSVIADQQACQSGESLTYLVPSTEYPSLQGGGCESVRGGIICSGWFTQFPAPLGPKMATRCTTCQLLWGVVQHDTVRACRRSPGRGGRPRLFSSIAELNSPNFPNAIRIPIYTYPHININVQSVFQFTRNSQRL